MAVTSFYAGLLALMFVVLSIRVVGRRRTAHVGLGDGGDRALLRRQRVHGNFAEYVPFALLLMGLGEAQGLQTWAVHGLGVLLVAGRVIHAFGVIREPEPVRWRICGMTLTFAVLVLGALANLALTGLIWLGAV